VLEDASNRGAMEKMTKNIELGLACHNLIKMDKDSDSDPIVMVYWKNPMTQVLSYTGREWFSIF
jgi:hypothetical protein